MKNQPALLKIDEQPDPREVAAKVDAERVTLDWKHGKAAIAAIAGPLFDTQEELF
jgi:hypothetical protein